MKKFFAVVTLVFALGIGAEWFLLGNPQKGVVLGFEFQRATDTFQARVMTNEGTLMNINVPSKVWREWFQIRINEE